MNESGEALLSWCALNGLVVLNTMYEKKGIHKYTWQHPGSKQWHCIDHLIMRQRQRHLCCGVSVLRSADCWTLCYSYTLGRLMIPFLAKLCGRR